MVVKKYEIYAIDKDDRKDLECEWIECYKKPFADLTIVAEYGYNEVSRLCKTHLIKVLK